MSRQPLLKVRSTKEADRYKRGNMDFPADLLYTKDHEWVRKSGDNTIVVGITTFAVEQLGDVTIVELPAVDDEITAADVFGTVESVKAVSDLFAPVTGRVTKVNEELNDAPELVNDDPYEKGWMVEIELKDPTSIDELLSAEAYTALVAEAD